MLWNILQRVLGRVSMLYVETQVNGIPVKALSIRELRLLSVSFFSGVRIMRLIDTRFAGIARGVGTAKILGRVHSAQVNSSRRRSLFSCSFTIMEGRDVELLFGLDMLKRFQAVIDLSQNSLIVQGKRIRFLDEHELPAAARMEGEVDAEGNPIPEPQTTASGSTSGAAQENAQAAQNTANREHQPAPPPNTFPGSGQSLGSSNALVNKVFLEEECLGIILHLHNLKLLLLRQRVQILQLNIRRNPSRVLTDLGATPEQAGALLDAAGGNVEIAASLLFQQ
ncbi:hypothetical protein L7F22_009692 [Adiantum nelumboides]|nr:hypothetical protein [Adiantum nelumboides]